MLTLQHTTNFRADRRYSSTVWDTTTNIMLDWHMHRNKMIFNKYKRDKWLLTVNWQIIKFTPPSPTCISTSVRKGILTSFFFAIFSKPALEAIFLTKSLVRSPMGNKDLCKAFWEICDRKNVWSLVLSAAVNSFTPADIKYIGMCTSSQTAWWHSSGKMTSG